MHKYKTHIRTMRNSGALEKILAALLHALFDDCPRPILIAIGGPGGTGKSTLATQLASALGDAVVLRLDDYKTAREFRQSQNLYGPHPDANKLSLIRDHLIAMQAGRPFDKPIYDSACGEAHHTVGFRPARFNIIDGEVATYREFRDLVDFSVFVDSDWKTQLQTRVSRDIDERGYTCDKAIATFLHSNLREFAEFGAESKAWADLHVYCHADYRLELESIAEEHAGVLEPIVRDDMRAIQLEGLIVPPCTPFGDDGRIDEPALVAHLEFMAVHGVSRLLINGTTAEFASLLPAERRSLLGVSRRYFPGMIMFNTGSDSLLQSLEAARWAADFGADAIVAMTPYYFADTDEAGLVRFFNQLRESVDIPMILYNFTKHTGNAITPSILEQVEHIAIKDSSGDMSLMASTPCYLAGTSKRIVGSMQAGAKGFVSTLACCMPKLYVELEAAVLSEAYNDAQLIQNEICERALAFGSPNEIASLKRDLAVQIPGYPTAMRLPLLEL